MKTFHGLISVQLFPLYQIAMLFTFEEWCMSFGNMMKTKMMTRHFKCNFNFETSISHHLSSFCHQSLIKLERDKDHIICDSLVIVQKYSSSASSCFLCTHPINIWYPECLGTPTSVKFIFSRLDLSNIYLLRLLFLVCHLS